MVSLTMGVWLLWGCGYSRGVVTTGCVVTMGCVYYGCGYSRGVVTLSPSADQKHRATEGSKSR